MTNLAEGLVTAPALPDQRGLRERTIPKIHAAVRQGLGCTTRELALAVGTALGLTLIWLAIIPVIDSGQSGGDTTTYLAMAANPKGVAWAPLAFRGLEPWLAQAIGGQYHYLLAFRLLTWCSLVAGGVAAYLICRRLGGVHRAAMVGMAGLMCLPMWLFFIHQPYLVDGPAMALMAWAIVALINGWLAILPLVLVVQGLARETVIGFSLPIYMWLRQRWVDLATAWKVALMVAPAVAAVWAIRQPMVFTGSSSTLALMKDGLFIYVRNDVFPRPQWWVFYGIAGSLGIWWVLAIHGRRHGGRLWWLLVPVFAQWLFGSDYARYALYAYPVVIAAGAMALWQHPRRVLLFALLAAQSLSVVADLVVNGHPRIYTLQPSTWINGGLILVAAAVVWWPFPLRSPRRPTTAQSGTDPIPTDAALTSTA